MEIAKGTELVTGKGAVGAETTVRRGTRCAVTIAPLLTNPAAPLRYAAA